jgi:DNA repair exonuclease SbcCD ATPase subunit
MSALFVALGILVLALLALLLWFVPHLLQQQATRVAGETAQLREMLLDLLSEQEAVTTRQTQLGSSLNNLQDQLSSIAHNTDRTRTDDRQTARLAETTIYQLESRLAELQGQIKDWNDSRQQGARTRSTEDNESWANLMGLLATIQERIGTLSQDRATALAGVQAGVLLEELEQEMQNLRGISEEIEMLQWRLRRSLTERESNLSVLRTRATNGA